MKILFVHILLLLSLAGYAQRMSKDYALRTAAVMDTSFSAEGVYTSLARFDIDKDVWIVEAVEPSKAIIQVVPYENINLFCSSESRRWTLNSISRIFLPVKTIVINANNGRVIERSERTVVHEMINYAFK